MDNERISRRTILRTVGAGVAGTALASRTAAAQPADDEYVVGFEPGHGRAAVRGAADSIRRELDFGPIGRAISGRFPEPAREALRNNPNVRYVEENGLMQAVGQKTPYGLERIDADATIAAGETGDGVSVAILDTGIDPRHEVLAENLGEGYAAASAACTTDCGFWYGNDIAECLTEWDDDNDHGTHVAGTAGAADNGVGVLGVAPEATLHPVKVLQCDGDGTFDDVAAGIKWSADRGHDVQNLSLASATDSSVVRDAVAYAIQRNVVVVAAAGNDGPCTDCVGYPAAYDEVIAVSATDRNDDLADLSSTGPQIDIAAPGADVTSAIPRDGYAAFSGTSMAAPHVAGAAAVLIAAGVAPDDVRARLELTADDVGLEAIEQGAGRLNVADALTLEDGDDGEDESGGSEDDGNDEDGTDDGDEDNTGAEETAPSIDAFAVSSRTAGPWTRATVDWRVSDADGDLETVTVELLAGTRVVASQSTAASDSTAADSHELRTREAAETVRLTVVDAAGAETSETRSL